MPGPREFSKDECVPADVTDTVNKVINDLQNHNASQAFADVDNFWREHRNDGEWTTFLEQMRLADRKAAKDPELKEMLDNFDITYTGNEKGTTGTLDIRYKDDEGKSSYHDAVAGPRKLDPRDILPGLIDPVPPFDLPPGTGPDPRTQPRDGAHDPRSTKDPDPEVGPGYPVGDPDNASTSFFAPDHRPLRVQPG
ncbi:MAG: hypothetical protein EKK48_13935 [Candidatus Melainabacteria bacterium]|nr:MAG: hypothetical protein EKK48_13935 [Candidatus Melainabacteria bacterium]